MVKYEKLRRHIEKGIKLTVEEVGDEKLQSWIISQLLKVRERLDGTEAGNSNP